MRRQQRHREGNPAHSSCAGKVIYINTATALGTVTLTDNSVLSVVAQDKAAYLTPTPVVASIANASMLEGNSGTTTMNVTVTLGPAPLTTVVVWYQTLDGTALAGLDYVAASGYVVFAAGELSKTVRRQRDRRHRCIEPDETLPGAAHRRDRRRASGRPLDATVTIKNDDAKPTIALAVDDRRPAPSRVRRRSSSRSPAAATSTGRSP